MVQASYTYRTARKEEREAITIPSYISLKEKTVATPLDTRILTKLTSTAVDGAAGGESDLKTQYDQLISTVKSAMKATIPAREKLKLQLRGVSKETLDLIEQRASVLIFGS